MRAKVIIYSLLSFVVASCSTVKFFNAEIQKPAQIYLPEDVKRVMIINNAGIQPADIGHYAYEEPVEVVSDSTHIILTQALAQFMNDENFFQNVALIDKSTKPHFLFLSEMPLETDEIKEYANQTNSDVIITLDRFITRSTLRSVITANILDMDYLKVNTDAVLRVYNSQGVQLAPQINYNDSIYWSGLRQGQYYHEYLPSREGALKEAALYAADNITKIFIPHWQTVERFYYTDGSTKMKNAAVKASANQWKDAALMWGEIYEEETNLTKKTKLAINIAIANEMLDDVENAGTWIDIATGLLNDANKLPDDELVVFAQAYKKDLHERLLDLKKLDIQNRKE